MFAYYFQFVKQRIKKKKSPHTGQIKGVTMGLEHLKKEKISTHLIVSRLVVLYGDQYGVRTHECRLERAMC